MAGRHWAAGAEPIRNYSEGLGNLELPGEGPVPGSSAIYDIATGRWLKGPTAPGLRADGPSAPAAIWTPYGVLSVAEEVGGGTSRGHPDGWLLRPRIVRR